MALDTRDKRASSINVSLPFRGLLPAPDGAIGSGDRAQSSYLYRGLADGGAQPTIHAEWLIRARRHGRR